MSYTIKENDASLQREIYADTKQDILDALEEIFRSVEGVAYWPHHREHDAEVEQNARDTMTKAIEEIKNKDFPDLTNVTDGAGNRVICYIKTDNQYYMKDYPGATPWGFKFYITRIVYSGTSLNNSSFILPDIKEERTVPFLSADNFGTHWAEKPLDNFVKIAQEPLAKTAHWGKWGDNEWSNIRPTVQFNTREIIEYIDRMTKGCGVPQEEIDNIEKYIISLNLPDLTDCYAINKDEAYPYIYATAIGVGYERGYGSIRIYHGISPHSFDEQFAYEGGIPFEVDDDEDFKELDLIAQFPITDNLNYVDDRTDDTYFQRYAWEKLPFLYREKQLRAEE